MVNIILNLILIESIGVVGASIATAASFLVTWVVRMYTIQKLVKVKIHLPQTIATYVLAITGCILIVYDVPYAYLFYLLLCGAVIALNYADVKNITVSTSQLIKKVLKRK